MTVIDAKYRPRYYKVNEMTPKSVHLSMRNILIFGSLDFQDNGNDSWTFQLISAQFIWLRKKIQNFKKEGVGNGAKYYSVFELDEERKVT